MVQTLVNVSLIASGLLLIFVLDGTGGERLFGAILAGIGVLALLSQMWLAARQQDDRGPPGRP